MSRTFRRKNYESTVGQRYRNYRSLAGYYTKNVFRRRTFDGSYYWSLNFVGSYRAPTEKEYYHDFWKLHRDNHQNAWSPNRDYRKFRQVQNRNINKTELAKWIKNENYEPLFEENPRSHYWDWD